MKSNLLALMLLGFCSGSVLAEAPVFDLNEKQFAELEEQKPQVRSQTPDVKPLFSEETTPQQMVESSDQEGAAAAPSTKEKLELLSQLQALQDEVKQLRGQVEVQNHDMAVLSTQISKGAVQPTPSNRPTLVKGVTIAAEGRPGAYVTTPQELAQDTEGNAAYQAAFVLVKDKKYAEATSAMEAFVQAHANSSYVANAHYWLGELYLAQGFVEKGMEQFNRVVHDFPNSSKASGATLKLGYAYYDKSRWLQARTQFDQVVKRYPESSEARLAKTRIIEMDKQGL